jgi:uncharacterized protein YndB with AHSA1/START domain
MPEGSASVVINRPPDEVFAAIADVTRTGEWSPECHACRWVGGVSAPGVGVKFEGDNSVAVGPVTLKKWTTTSEITAYEPGSVFEFVAEGYTTWRYDFAPSGTGTKVTESYRYAPATGVQKFLYETVMRRPAAMIKGMQQTLDRIKASLES